MSVIPTKANLTAAKKSLALAKLGYELLDRKQSIMLRELTSLAGAAEAAHAEVNAAFAEAYEALRRANIQNGSRSVDRIALSTPVKDDVDVLYRSLMGVELPEIRVAEKDEDGARLPFTYGLFSTTAELDDAYIKFNRLRTLIIRAAESENAAKRLAESIGAAKKRVGALGGVVIPRLEGEIKFITEALEERERDSFAAMKTLKKRKA